jgi:hypothetical protein
MAFRGKNKKNHWGGGRRGLAFGPLNTRLLLYTKFKETQSETYLLEDGAAKVCSVSNAGVEHKVRRSVAHTEVVLQQTVRLRGERGDAANT